MDHLANGRLVDAHTEGAGGHHDVHLVLQESMEDSLPDIARQSGVVRRRAKPMLPEHLGDEFALTASGRIDDGHAVSALERPEQGGQPGPIVTDLNDPQPEIGAVKGTEDETVAPKAE
jgi:hypothetical protein